MLLSALDSNSLDEDYKPLHSKMAELKQKYPHSNEVESIDLEAMVLYKKFQNNKIKLMVASLKSLEVDQLMASLTEMKLEAQNFKKRIEDLENLLQVIF